MRIYRGRPKSKFPIHIEQAKIKSGFVVTSVQSYNVQTALPNFHVEGIHSYRVLPGDRCL